MNTKKLSIKNKAPLIILCVCVFCGCVIENYLFYSKHIELSMDSIFINPLLITLLFIYITDITNPNYNKIPMVLSVLAIFSVNNEIKQIIYFNSYGTMTLIILITSFFYYDALTKRINGEFNKADKLVSYVSLIILCLLEHSLALATIISILFLLITTRDKLLKRSLLIDIIVSGITLIGSKCYQYLSLKAISSFNEWSNLSLWKKFASGYDAFLLPMFRNNMIIVIMLSACLIILLLRTKKHINSIYKYISLIINIISILLLIMSLFVNVPWYLEYLFWPIYIINTFITLLIGSNTKTALLFYIVAGLSSFFICFNPLHNTYDSIYTVYYTILIANVLINELLSQNQ